MAFQPTTSPTTPSPITASHTKSPLLSLPAELRLQIYEAALCPTHTLHLTSTKTLRATLSPSIAPSLLRTNQQIHRETLNLLTAANELCLSIDAHDTCWPIISASRLPQPILERLPHLFLILDCTSNFRAAYEDVDFTPLEALRSLQTLRLAVMYDESSGLGEVFAEFNALSEILSRVPRETKVRCRVDEGSMQEGYLEEMVAKRKPPVNQWANGQGSNLRYIAEERKIGVIGKEVLQAAVDAVDKETWGTKLGAHRDVFAACRSYQGTALVSV